MRQRYHQELLSVLITLLALSVECSFLKACTCSLKYTEAASQSETTGSHSALRGEGVGWGRGS